MATKAEPEAGDVTVTEDTVTETADVGPAAKASGGSSLFDVDDSSTDTAPQKSVADTPSDATRASGTPKKEESGSLFDLGGDEPAEKPAESAAAAPAPAEPAGKPASKPQTDLGSGGSLFDLGGDEPAEKPAEQSAPAEPAAATPAPAEPAEKPAAKPQADLGSGGSLFDLTADEPAPAKPAPAAQPDDSAQASVPSEAPAQPAPAKAETPKAAPRRRPGLDRLALRHRRRARAER